MSRTAAILATGLLAAAPALAQPPRYTVTGLGNLGLEGAFASGLSEDGQVVGRAYTLDPVTGLFSQQAPFVYRQGVTTPLASHDGLGVWASDVNSAGQMAGFSYTLDPTFGSVIYQRALLIDGGQTSDLGTLGGARAQARAINESGQIAGTSRIAGSSLTHAYRYSQGVMTDLGAPAGGRSTGMAINALGVVAGTITLPGNNEVHPALFKNGQITDLGIFGGAFGSARAVNDAGQVVGYSDTNALQEGVTINHAFLYDGGVLHDLGSFAGRQFTMATDINNRGQIVGLAFDESEFDNQVFLREGDQTFDLNHLLDPARAAGWTITGVYAINDRGQIAGDGIFNGVRQAVLLTPVPEAPAATLLALGLAVLALRRRRPGATA